MKKVLYFLILALVLMGCKKQPFLNVDKTSLSFSSAGGAEQISVSANYAWTASASADWIKIKCLEADNLLKVSVEANENTDGRQGTILIESEGLTVNVPISQNQRDAIELETSDRVLIDAEAQQLEIKLNSNVEVSASVVDGSDWVAVVSTKTMTPYTVTFSVKENEGKNARSALLSFKDESGAISRLVAIDQEGRPQILRVTFRQVESFGVPRLDGVSGLEFSATVFWDGAETGVPYEWPLLKPYDGSAGSLRIEAKNAGSVSFPDVRGLLLIDLSEF